MDQVCFNCYQKGHLSINCPIPSKFTRCDVCHRVCKEPDDHWELCALKHFKSEYITTPDSARSGTLLADIKFAVKSAVYLVYSNQQVDVSGDFLPMQINGKNGLLLGNKKNIKYYEWYPPTNNRCVVNVMDSKNIVRFSVRIMDDAFIVNKKIRVRRNGLVEFREGIVTNPIMEENIMFKVDQERRFDMTVYAFGQNYAFEVSQDDVKYVQPEWKLLFVQSVSIR